MDNRWKLAQDTNERQTKQNATCVGHRYAQDTRERLTKHNATQYVLDTVVHKTKEKDKQNTAQHNMC